MVTESSRALRPPKLPESIRNTVVPHVEVTVRMGEVLIRANDQAHAAQVLDELQTINVSVAHQE